MASLNPPIALHLGVVMKSSSPLVSCVMLTRDNPRLAAQAVRCFLRQDYVPRELVIIDDGAAPVADALPADERIRVIRLDRQRSTGHKHNVGCQAGRGPLVAHWEDSDWHSSRRLAVQVATLRESAAEAVGLAPLLHYSPSGGSVWTRQYPEAKRAGIATTTLLFRKEVWIQQPFADRERQWDEEFLARLPASGLIALDDPMLYVAIVHAGNAGRHNFTDPWWFPRTIDDVAHMLITDWEFYSTLRTGGAPPGRALAADSITLSAHFMVSDGYGSMAEYIALGMDRAGAKLDIVPSRIIEAGLSERLLELIRNSQFDPAAPLLHHSTVDAGFRLFERCPDYVISTMWESDGLPSNWLPAMHRARALVAPSRWCANVFRAHGLTRPIHVVPDGVDPAVYHYRPPTDRDGVVTLMVGTNLGRKHLPQGIAAWQRAFAGDRLARLLLKAHHQYAVVPTDDPRISYVDVNEPSRGIAHWYHRADVLMALGNEGFGLPLVEAMACGLTVIGLDAEGQGDVCADAAGLVLPVHVARWEPHIAGFYGRCGKRSVPDIDQAAQQLRWVAEHRDEARELGRKASEWVALHRNVWDKGPALVEIMESGLDPPRSLRKVGISAHCGAPVRRPQAHPKSARTRASVAEPQSVNDLVTHHTSAGLIVN